MEIVEPDALRHEAEAIKIDKVTVWKNCGGGKEGKTSTSNFISGMYKAVPPLQEMFNMAGMQLPNYLKGENIEDVRGSKPLENSTSKETED